MTVEDLVRELWGAMGEPKGNYDPRNDTDSTLLDTSKVITQRYLRVLDWAQNQITSWKDGKFTQRLHYWTGAFQRRYLSLTGITEVGDAGSTTALFSKPAGGTLASGIYEGYVAVLGDEVREIVADTGNSFIVSPSFTSTMLGQSVTVRPLAYELPGKNAVKTVQQVWLQDTGSQLTEAPREERFMQNEYTLGEPTQWFQKGKYVYLDAVPDADYYLKLVVEATPAKISGMALTDEPEIPPQFHWGILLWSLGWGHGLLQEESRKLAYQAEFRDFMRETMNESDMDGFLSDGAGIRVGEGDGYMG